MADFKYVDPFAYLKKDRENDRLRRYYTIRNMPRKLLLLPGRSNSSSDYLRFMRELNKRLDEAFPQSTHNGAGYTIPGVAEDWTRMTSIQGIMPNPAGTPPYDSTIAMRERFEGSQNQNHVAYALGSLHERGEHLAGPFSLLPSTKRMIDTVVDLLVGRAEPGSIPVKETVSTGLPGMDKDLPMKKKWGDNWCDPKWAQDTLAYVVKGHLKQLYEKKDIMLAYAQGYRTQPDRLVKKEGRLVPRERLVYDWMGQWTTADRALPTKWLETHSEGSTKQNVDEFVKGFYCCRSRQISQAPYRATFPVRLIAHSVYNHMATAWPWTIEHRSITSLNAKIAGARSIRLVDVDNHDQSINKYILESFIRRLGELFHGDVVALIQLMYHAPSLVRNDYRFEAGASWRGNPFDPDSFQAWYVNPSGDPNTSNLAKVAGIVYAIYVFACHIDGPIAKEWMTSLLLGTLDYGFLNAGDNLLFYDKRESSFLDREDWADCLYFAQLSTSPSFLGMVPIQDAKGAKVTFMANIQSFIYNFFLADKGIESPDRRYWAFGWFERKESYQTNPMLKDADAIVQNVARSTLGVTIDDLAEENYRTPLNVTGLNAAEVEFIANPDVVYYKYRNTDIRDELLQQYFLTYHPNRTAELWRYIKGE